jgi:hypothetical protein
VRSQVPNVRLRVFNAETLLRRLFCNFLRGVLSHFNSDVRAFQSVARRRTAIEDFYVPFIAISQKLKAALIQIKKTGGSFSKIFHRIGD